MIFSIMNYHHFISDRGGTKGASTCYCIFLNNVKSVFVLNEFQRKFLMMQFFIRTMNWIIIILTALGIQCIHQIFRFETSFSKTWKNLWVERVSNQWIKAAKMIFLPTRFSCQKFLFMNCSLIAISTLSNENKTTRFPHTEWRYGKLMSISYSKRNNSVIYSAGLPLAWSAQSSTLNRNERWCKNWFWKLASTL